MILGVIFCIYWYDIHTFLGLTQVSKSFLGPLYKQTDEIKNRNVIQTLHIQTLHSIRALGFGSPRCAAREHPVSPSNYNVTSTLCFCAEGTLLHVKPFSQLPLKPEREGRTWLRSGLWHWTFLGSCHERLSSSAPLWRLPFKRRGFLARRPPDSALLTHSFAHSHPR